LLKKIIEIEQKPSLYNSNSLKGKPCPAFDKQKKTFKSKFQTSQLENQNFVKKIINAEIIQTSNNRKAPLSNR
jgi:hypothetical protein